MDKLNSCKPIIVGSDYSINNITFDGCAYYCTTTCKCEILMINECYKIQKKFDTFREYDCICYDWCDHCFWASSKNCNNKLFKLDCDMNEIDCITIFGIDYNDVLTGISYNCFNNTLLVSLASVVVEVDKYCEKTKLLYCMNNSCILSVISLYPGMIITVLKDNNYYVEIFDSCFKCIRCNKVGNKNLIKNLMFNPCSCSSQLPHIDVFMLKKHFYPYICSYAICNDELGFVPSDCNYTICQTTHDKQHCNPCQNACTDVLESIALIETALSHILNAEGEKIQKILGETDDIDIILCVNQEVNKTIVNATHLEQVLYAKLSVLTDCGFCSDICKDKCDSEDMCIDNDSLCSCNTDDSQL